MLDTLSKILERHNALGGRGSSARKLWQRMRFGNGQMADLGNLRARLAFYTSALSLSLNMASLGSMGRIEMQIGEVGGHLKDIKLAVHSITARFSSQSSHEGSILTIYSGDDKIVWKEFRRELLKEGFSSAILQKHKSLIKAYVMELGDRGLLDQMSDQQQREPYSDFGFDFDRSPSQTFHKSSPETALPSLEDDGSSDNVSLLTMEDAASFENQERTHPTLRTNALDSRLQSPWKSTDKLPRLLQEANEYITLTRERAHAATNDDFPDRENVRRQRGQKTLSLGSRNSHLQLSVFNVVRKHRKDP